MNCLSEMWKQVSLISGFTLFSLYEHWPREGFWETTVVWKNISFRYFVILIYDMVCHMVKAKSKNGLYLRTSPLLIQRLLPCAFVWPMIPWGSHMLGWWYTSSLRSSEGGEISNIQWNVCTWVGSWGEQKDWGIQATPFLSFSGTQLMPSVNIRPNFSSALRVS